MDRVAIVSFRSFQPLRILSKNVLAHVFLISLSINLLSQEIILTGKVIDAGTGTPMNSVAVQERTSLNGTLTDRSGSFRLRLEQGYQNIVISHLGFNTIDTIIHAANNSELIFHLIPLDVELGEVVITSEGAHDLVQSSEMGSFFITRKEIARSPTLLGEIDPLGLIRLTPGVQSGSEGTSGFYVRGGGVDQNLILYDNALVYNPGHLIGFFSVFNPEFVKDVTITKSGISATHGGKLSSVIKIRSYKGSRDSVEFNGNLGIIASRFTLSAPLFGKKGTIILGGRLTYLDLFVMPLITSNAKNKSFFNEDNVYNFYDLNAGLSLNLTGRDEISFSAYHGRDNYTMYQEGIKQKNTLYWGNTIASFDWKHSFRNKSVWNSSFSRTEYVFDLKGSQSEYYFKLLSSVDDYNLKSDIAFTAGNHSLVTGLELTDHRFVPNKIDARASEFLLNFGQFNNLYALEGGLYVDDEFPLTDKFSFSGGIRYSFFNHHGPFRKYVRNSFDQIIDTLFYARSQSLAFYQYLEPRAVLKFEINKSSSVKASYMRIAQYVHLATSASVSMPTDIWIPSTDYIKPMVGNQVSLGYFKNIRERDYVFSAEVYYKAMRNKLEFLRGIVFNSIYGNLEENIAFGTGRSYGLEFYLGKQRGSLTGGISYVLARTEQSFDKINDGKFYPAKYDRRHDLALTLNKQFNVNWNGSAVFVFTSGNAFTMPVGRYIIQGNIVNQYGEVNQFRMPPYHRLDLSLTRQIMIRKKWKSELNFSVFNVYNRANPYFIYFEAVGEIENYTLEIKALKVTLFPVIPSISWNFTF